MKTFKKILLGIGIFLLVIITLAVVMTQGIADTARNQLAAMRAGDAAKAYALTSKAFQRETNFEEFRKFMAAYPVLANHESLSVSDRETDKGVGSVKGELVAKDGTKTPIAYRLVKEDTEWKIEGIKLDLAAAPPAAAKARPQPVAAQDGPRPAIANILISDTAGADGYVEQHKPVLSKSAPKIYVTGQVENARKGLVISATLTYLANGGSIGPLSSEFTSDGALQRAFSFTNTQPEWPTGDFQATITLSDGSKKVADFKIQ